ncbi:MFS transporter [Aliirhizobium smilacinae]|uniref:MFS transporter n=1 Tax=Aliirhizobium smilacinae TaxID=1395944 RepID=A0A5C4XN12_9HYPH|nr:MFS transporter [Rhizobium smilacinae]TNM64812.1 MFS transporter [Rhizobium smilacinae]
MNIAEKPSAAPPQFQLRCSLAYAAPMSLNGILVPYLPLWLHGLNFTPMQIGAILAAQVVFRVFVAMGTGFLSARASDPRHILVWSAGTSLLSILGLIVSGDFWVVFAAVAVQAALFAPYTPMVESISISGVKRWGFHYGKLRVWGSVGFVATTLIAGSLSTAIGNIAIPLMLAGVLLTSFFVAFIAPRLDPEPGSRRAARPLRASSRPLGAPVHLLLIGASLIQSSHGMFYGFSTIQWQTMGFSNGAISALWCIGVIAEIGIFFVSGSLARRLTPLGLLYFGCLMAILRWTFFPLGSDVWYYGLLQIFHAFSFACVHLGLQYRLSEMVGEDQQASAQGVYVAYNGAFLAISTLLAGIIYRQLEIYGYFAMALLALLGLAVLAFAARSQPHRSGVGG